MSHNSDNRVPRPIHAVVVGDVFADRALTLPQLVSKNGIDQGDAFRASAIQVRRQSTAHINAFTATGI